MKFPRLVSNKAAWLVYLFIMLLCVLLWARVARSAEVDLRFGSSMIHGGAAPVVGLDLKFQQDPSLALVAGTLLWGENHWTGTNWSWQAGFEACRWQICGSLGAAYVQRIDRLSGSHANFSLQLAYRPTWGRRYRFNGVDWAHLSNAGTTAVNYGRNAALVDFRLR